MNSKNELSAQLANRNLLDENPVDLTDEQVAFFQENGYLSIPRITTDDEIEWLKGIYDELFTERTGEAQGRYFDLAGRVRTMDRKRCRRSWDQKHNS